MNFISLPSLLLLLLLVNSSVGLDTDVALLLSFKYSVLSDPSSVLDSWHYDDVSPCFWTGVKCEEIVGFSGGRGSWRVVGLSLPNVEMVGSLPEDLGLIPYLRNIDLSGNFINGSLPSSLFNSSAIEDISLANNAINGWIPDHFAAENLRVLNLSDNALTGNIPANLASLTNLTVVSVRNNYLSGEIPAGFLSAEFLDFSANMLNGSLPGGFGGEDLRYLNLSHNRISGPVSPEFADRVPASAAVDLSYNILSGKIPENTSFSGRKSEAFIGNPDLCGKPLRKLCTVPSTLSLPVNITVNTTSPAIAAIPRIISPATASVVAQPSNQHGMKVKPAALAGIAVAPLAGFGFFVTTLFLYFHQMKKKKKKKKQNPASKELNKTPMAETRSHFSWHCPWPCLKMSQGNDTSETTSSDDNGTQTQNQLNPIKNCKNQRSLVMVDGETELELETLLTASAFVLGSYGDTIVYKAVLADGTSFAVRRIGEYGISEMKIFEQQVKSMAKLCHENLVRVRGFYWGEDEKLILHDYISSCSLANISYWKVGSSPYLLSFGNRLKIARGVARGLKYIHDKKFVHGNVKPSNILLTQDMEPMISDLGVVRLVYGKILDGSSGHFGSRRRSSTVRKEQVDQPGNESPNRAQCTSPYHAPESFKNLKPNPKWDVFSFGIILLELLTGKVFSDRDISQWDGGAAECEDRSWAMRMVDGAVRGEAAELEGTVVAWFELGFRCASLLPQKRPCMKEALHVLERV